jgi:uncharacterized protein YbjT (DUF2867 family)
VRVVVFGASGTIGRVLLPALDREHEVVAVSRRPRAAQSERTHWAVADASDSASVRRVLEATQVVYYLVHSLGSPDFEERDRQAAEIVAREAERAGVAQIIYLGGLGDDAPGLSPHLRSRIETGRRLASGGVPVTVLRAAMVIGPGSAAFETIVALVDRLPGMVTPRWVSTPTQPIALVDVVRYLAGLCGLEKAFGASFDAGGPEVMTYREMIERIARLPVLLLAALGDAGQRPDGSPPDRRAAQPDRGPRRPDPGAAAVPAHRLRGGGPGSVADARLSCIAGGSALPGRRIGAGGREGRSDPVSTRTPSSFTRVILAGTRAWKSARVRPRTRSRSDGWAILAGGWPLYLEALAGVGHGRRTGPRASQAPTCRPRVRPSATDKRGSGGRAGLIGPSFWAWHRMVEPRDEPVHLSDSRPETHQHWSPAGANCCYSLLLDPDATIGIDLHKRLFLLVTGRGE